MPLSRGYIHVYNDYYRTSALKLLGKSKPNFMWSLLGQWERKFILNGTGHMTKMAAMLLYGKNFQKSNRPRYQVSVYRTIGPLVLDVTICVKVKS